MTREEKIKDLQRQLDELKAEPKLEAGKWYKDETGGLICVTELEESGFRGYGFYASDQRFHNELGECYDRIISEATPEEVETALIEEARRRGFKEGVRVRYNWGAGLDNSLSDSIAYYSKEGLKMGHCTIFRNGIWAEIISEPKVIVNGYEMEQEGDIIKFGCAKMDIDMFIDLYDIMDYYNRDENKRNPNRKIKSITLDSGVEITVEQLKEIVDNIK